MKLALKVTRKPFFLFSTLIGGTHRLMHKKSISFVYIFAIVCRLFQKNSGRVCPIRLIEAPFCDICPLVFKLKTTDTYYPRKVRFCIKLGRKLALRGDTHMTSTLTVGGVMQKWDAIGRRGGGLVSVLDVQSLFFY